MDFYKKYGKYVVLVSFIFIGILVVLYATKKDKSSDDATLISVTPSPTVTVAPTEAIEVEDDHTGEAKSKLTGLWIPEEEAMKRPYAIMFNNIKIANPQSGISDASILYEALTEGGITRLMGVFENISEDSLTAKRIGSVRSARHYYVSFADEYDAIFIHFGKTTYANKKMQKLGIDHLDGNMGIGASGFYRDKAIKAPHNAFTSLEGIQKVIDKAGFRTTYEEGYRGHFLFMDEGEILTSDVAANKVSIKFSTYAKPYFIYDKENSVYQRYQYDQPHVDANTNEILTFKNIIVQFVKEWDIDKNGYQTMDIENAEGEGYYITNGGAIPITWTKNESTGIMRYYNLDKTELSIHPGKTYIAVFPNSKTSDVVFE